MDSTIEYICFICIMIPLFMMTITVKAESRLLTGSVALGLFICLFSSEVSGAVIRAIGLSDVYYITTTATPIIEEMLKAIPLLVYAFRFSSQRDKLLSCGFGLGVGFAVLENIVILLRAVISDPESANYLWAFVRGFGSGLMHSVSTMMVGVVLSIVMKQKKLLVPGIFAILSVAAAYHAIYNALVQTDLKYLGFVLPLATYIALAPMTFKGQGSEAAKEVA